VEEAAGPRQLLRAGVGPPDRTRLRHGHDWSRPLRLLLRRAFSLYTWLAASTLFASTGAGSPGVVSEDSQVFAQLEELGDGGQEAKLHVISNDRELLGDRAIYQNSAKNTATLLHRLTARGEAVTSEVLRGTHVTGLQVSFLGYLRTCRA
jgi:predicted alpha/beta superfamily hydrolase